MTADERPFRPVEMRDAVVVGDALLDDDGVSSGLQHLERTPGPVTLADRQGVFVHSFKCLECDLEFATFSWRAFRHRADTLACPECRTVTPKMHWASQLSGEATFDGGGASPEIWTCVPLFGGTLKDDSSAPPEHRHRHPDGEPPAGQP
ncbi:hypothetical protein [Quadrisphaera sp. KR29]|uniref:hypothetical protein n=1 Tax=Quadrisphaera sp. KR29 TaxID=3461391 RepID=UPI004044BC5E